MSRSKVLSALLLLALTGFLAWCNAPKATPEEIDRLVEQLGDARFRVREQATQKLIKIGRPAVPALRKAMESQDVELKMRAQRILKTIQSSVEKLIDDLKHGDAAARREAAETLGQMGAKAKEAVPALVELLKHKDESVRDAAASALTGIDPENRALANLIPANAHVNGKYSKLLRKIHVPQDRQSYGDYHEWGQYGATDWQGHRNIPAGFWVYVYPHWYIWGESKGGQPAGQLVPAPQQRGFERPLTK
jgi:hypothetical protein